MSRGRELVLAALDNRETLRAPWVPFVGVHGGHLIGCNATELLHSAELIHQAHLAAIGRYRPDGLPVVFDLQLEAEVLGCELQWAEDLPPSVVSHPLEGADLSELKMPAFDLTAGRFPMVFDALHRLRQHARETLAIYGLITGPLTLAMHLRGNDLFLDMYDDPEGTLALLAACARVGCRVADAYVDGGADVVAVVDPMVSQVSPDHFDQFVAAAENQVFDSIRARGARGSMFVCGDATRVLDRLFATHCHSVSVDENIPLGTVRETARRHGKSFGGNLKLTTVLLLGSETDSRRHAVECLDIGGNRGFVFSPGCDLPFGVAPENLEAVASVVNDPYQREVARMLVDVGTRSSGNRPSGSCATWRGEGDADAVVVDVVTLDSGACAPCQYMMDAARRAAAAVEGRVVVREHKVKNREGIAAMCALKVGNIPTLCIDGEVRFVSIIPDQPTLIRAIQEKVVARATH